MTGKEASRLVYRTITEINKKLGKKGIGKNRIIREACNRNNVSEKHIRRVGGYDR